MNYTEKELRETEMYTTREGTIEHTFSVWEFINEGMSEKDMAMYRTNEGENYKTLLESSIDLLNRTGHSEIYVKDGKEYQDIECTILMNEVLEITEMDLPHLIEVFNDHSNYLIKRFKELGWKDNVQMELVVNAMINGGHLDTWEDRYSLMKLTEDGTGFLFNLGLHNFNMIKEDLEDLGELETISCTIKLKVDKEKLIHRIIGYESVKNDTSNSLHRFLYGDVALNIKE